jgi:hypothetical protein
MADYIRKVALCSKGGNCSIFSVSHEDDFSNLRSVSLPAPPGGLMPGKI